MFALLLATLLPAHAGPPPAPPPAAPVGLADTTRPAAVTGLVPVKTASGLEYYVLRAGAGAAPLPGQTVAVHYTGWMEDGTKFDSSVDRGQLFTFAVGASKVIKGWDEGVSTMKVGELRQLRVPAALAYGDKGAGGMIPPGANLIFDVELVELR